MTTPDTEALENARQRLISWALEPRQSLRVADVDAVIERLDYLEGKMRVTPTPSQSQEDDQNDHWLTDEDTKRMSATIAADLSSGFPDDDDDTPTPSQDQGELRDKIVTEIAEGMFDCNDPHEIADAILALLPSQAGAWRPPEGWALVPIDPTREMIYSAIDVDSFKLGDISPLGFRISADMLLEKCWSAMLDAAPPAPGAS